MPQGQMSRRCCLKEAQNNFVLACVAFALALNIVVVVLAVHCLTRNNELAPDNSKMWSGPTKQHLGPIACVRCEDDPDDRLWGQLVRLEEAESEPLCCAENNAGMAALMELILQTPVPVEGQPQQELTDSRVLLASIRAGNYSLGLASAHKQLLPPELFDSAKEPVPRFHNSTPVFLLLNESQTGPLEHQHQVAVTRDGLQVREAGLYQVYSNIRYSPDSNRPCREFATQTWEQVVTRTAIGIKEKILKSTHTCCDSCIGVEETSYTAGHFYLKSGDLLQVSISGLGLVSFYPESSYFGLAMLGASAGSR